MGVGVLDPVPVGVWVGLNDCICCVEDAEGTDDDEGLAPGVSDDVSD